MTSTTPLSTARAAVPNSVQSATLAEERREVFESVLLALSGDPLDADRLAAGDQLLRHLSRTAATPP